MAQLQEIENEAEAELEAAGSGHLFKPHWQIFVPTIIILVSYCAAMAYLWATGRGDTALFRLFAIVAGIGVPLLAAHAFLRFETVRVLLKDDSICYHPGWPKDRMLEVPHKLIERTFVKRGLAGNLLGGGTLVIETSTGGRIAIADLCDPDAIVESVPIGRWEPAG